MAEKKEIRLKVASAYQRDVGRGIVRIDRNAMRKIGVQPGDIVEIIGTKNTAAVVWPAYPEDEGLDIIRMDGTIRKNAGVGLGDEVTIRKAEVKEAQKVVLAPTEPIRFGQDFVDWLHSRLVGRPVVRGDYIRIGVLGQELTFVVTATTPSGVVQITEFTEFTISEKPVKEVAKAPALGVTYEDIGGLKDVIQKIREMIELPLKHPEIFEKLGIEPPKGVLLYGPPGTGKTLLAKAVANEANAHFIAINGPEIMSKYYGESEERLREVFKEAEENAPSIIFIDEIDAIAPRRGTDVNRVTDRLINQLLTEMDGIEENSGVVVIAATNRPDILDPALLRPGRFDRLILVPAPDEKARLEIFKVHTRNVPLAEDVSREELAKRTEGYTGADIEAVVREAALNAMRRAIAEGVIKPGTRASEIRQKVKVTMKDFEEALKKVGPSVSKEMMEYYRKIEETLKKGRAELTRENRDREVL
jgi:transitional endoplasmic reticulum ATPase